MNWFVRFFQVEAKKILLKADKKKDTKKSFSASKMRTIDFYNYILFYFIYRIITL